MSARRGISRDNSRKTTVLASLAAQDVCGGGGGGLGLFEFGEPNMMLMGQPSWAAS